MMKVPFFDLKRQYKEISADINEAVSRVIKKQYFILGEELIEFEKDFSEYLSVKHVSGVNSGTDGLILALKSIGIKKGDEVITPTQSFIATSLAISWLGATPIFVDSSPETFNIDTEKIEEKITTKTKAILTVHLYGLSSDMGRIMDIAAKNNLKVIADACQAHGSEYKGRKAGTMGDIGVFSFYPSKNLGAYGDAGALCTDDEELYERIVMLRNYGQTKKYYHQTEGINTRMDELQAAILKIKLKHLDKWNSNRNTISNKYKSELEEIYQFQEIPNNYYSNYHLLVIIEEDRKGLMDCLSEKGIGTLIHYPVPIHLQKAYSYLNYKKGDFPVAEKVMSQCLSLPMFPEMRQNEVEYVVQKLKDYKKTRN